MKKLLLGTTALVLLSGAAAAQQVTTSSPFTVTLGGSVRYDFGFFDEDASNVNRESRIDSRILLKAEAKADNGLTYGFSGRFRSAGGAANGLNLDYKYIYAKGTWGTVNLGDYQGAATQLEVIAPTVGIGQADAAGIAALGNASMYWATEDVPNTKITYLTPSFSGFQAGLSYTPEQDGGRVVTKGGARYTDIWEVAAQYSAEFSGIGITVGGGYETGSESVNYIGDYQIWNLGATVSYAGFTFGGNYYDNGESTGADEQTGWAVGLTYAQGAWGVGTSYVRTNTNAAGPGGSSDDSVFGVGGAYKLAPGLSLQADVNLIDAESIPSDGWQVVVRTRVDF